MKTKEKIIIVICLIIAIIILTMFALARYMTSVNGNAEADIAKWTLKVTDGTNESLSINLAKTRDENQEAEVQSDYIGPGTSGKFIIEVNATDTDVSLEYNINMEINYNDNHEFPKNLIFYFDEKMTNAIYHTDNAIELNGFIGEKDGNKVIQHKIYWKWDFETGQTESDKNDNDIADSWWIGENVVIPITVVGMQVNQNPKLNQYAVTFDANGGIIGGYGNSEKMTRLVNYNEEYGYLPTPIRDGYIFDGWTGKNLWSNEEIQIIENGEFDNNKIIFNTQRAMNTENQTLKFQIWNNGKHIESLEQYKFDIGYKTYSFKKKEGYNKIKIGMNGNKQDAWVFMGISTLKNEVTYTVSLNVDVWEQWYMEISNIQLEEGEKATSYEPYQIVNCDTIMTKNNNHSLVAKWIKAE